MVKRNNQGAGGAELEALVLNGPDRDVVLARLLETYRDARAEAGYALNPNP